MVLGRARLINTQSRHDALSLESVLAFQKVSHLIPPEAPVILESRVEESEINQEMENALKRSEHEESLCVCGRLENPGTFRLSPDFFDKPRVKQSKLQSIYVNSELKINAVLNMAQKRKYAAMEQQMRNQAMQRGEQRRANASHP